MSSKWIWAEFADDGTSQWPDAAIHEQTARDLVPEATQVEFAEPGAVWLLVPAEFVAQVTAAPDSAITRATARGDWELVVTDDEWQED